MHNKTKKISFYFLNSLRRIRRTIARSILALLVPAVMLALIFEFASLRQTQADLIKNTAILSSFTGELRFSILNKLISSEYVADAYYEGNGNVSFNIANPYRDTNIYINWQAALKQLIVTNNIERYINYDISIEYAPGYDKERASSFGDTIILGKELAESSGLHLGDTVAVASENALWGGIAGLKALYRSQSLETLTQDVDVSDEELLAMFYDEYFETLSANWQVFTVAGILASSDPKYDNMAFTPGPDSSMMTLPPLEIVEFRLSDNNLIDECRAFCENIAGSDSLFVMDISNLESLKNAQNTTNLLFPIVFAAAILIDGFLSVFIVFRSAKEVAMMLLHGISRQKAILILSLEQSVLSLVGLLVSGILLLLISGSNAAMIFNSVLLFAVLYFCVSFVFSAASAIILTRKSPLSLLKVDE
ncbi:MAG: hypothetical protein FWH57_11760 [Oscillospiraceae bacterium]|nr:hypothetical protein [Oscillospiraceae bacterium]